MVHCTTSLSLINVQIVLGSTDVAINMSATSTTPNITLTPAQWLSMFTKARERDWKKEENMAAFAEMAKVDGWHITPLAFAHQVLLANARPRGPTPRKRQCSRGSRSTHSQSRQKLNISVQQAFAASGSFDAKLSTDEVIDPSKTALERDPSKTRAPLAYLPNPISPARSTLILDVRAPIEFEKAHIPGAVNIPLFDDDERSRIGTAFKRNGGRPAALKLGMRYVIPKFKRWAVEVRDLLREEEREEGKGPISTSAAATATVSASVSAAASVPTTTSSTTHPHRIIIYCARGGMRSHAFAWLMHHHFTTLLSQEDESATISSIPDAQFVVLEHGYKGFLRWARLGVYAAESYARPPPPLCIIGGRSGSGKTMVLRAIERLGEEKGEEAEGKVGRRGSSSSSSSINGSALSGHVVGVPLHSQESLFAYTIDLEGLANHRGSTFGEIGQHPGGQPAANMFLVYVALKYAAIALHYGSVCSASHTPKRFIFIEDEGPAIGKVSTPPALYALMRAADHVVRLVVPLSLRTQTLVQAYASPKVIDSMGLGVWRDKMVKGLRKLKKHVDKRKMKDLITAIDEKVSV